MGLTIGSLCSGIGGLDLAVADHYGAEVLWHAEIEAAPAAILERHWPGVPNLGDLTVADWSTVPRVDILTAGYPCQPFSHAGKRKGSKDVRHLWPHIIDAIRHLRPARVVVENVRGHLTLGFDEVLWSLAEAGFDAEWCVLRASDVGACHQRARLFVVATDARCPEWWAEGRPRGEAGQLVVPRERHEGPASPIGNHDAPADAGGERHGGGQDTGGVGRVDREDAGGARQRQRPWEVVGDRSGQAPADPDGEHDDRGRDARGPGVDAHEPWGQYAPAIDRWERTLGRRAPAPTDDRGRLSPAFVEWMMGYPAGWVDGLARTQALKALGNAVVPQQAAAALQELDP